MKGNLRLIAGMFLMGSTLLAIAPMLPTIQERSGLSVAVLGLISAASLVAGMLAELTLGPQADRGHERVLCLSSVALAVVALAWSSVADDVLTLVLSRALAGVAYSAFVSAASAVIIRADPDRVGQGVARLQAAEIAGLAAGPMLGAILEPVIGLTPALLVIAGLTLLALPLLWGLRTTVSIADDEDPPPALAFDLLGRSSIWVALLLAIALMVPVGAFDAMWSRYLQDLGASHVLVAVSFAATTLPFLVFAPFTGRLVDRWGPMAGVTRGMAIVVASLAAYATLTHVWGIIGIATLEAFGQALAGPGAAAAMAHASGASRAGAGQGLARATSLLAAGLVALAAGPVYAQWGGFAVFGGAAVGVGLMVVAARVLAALRAPELLHAPARPAAETSVAGDPAVAEGLSA